MGPALDPWMFALACGSVLAGILFALVFYENR